MTTIVTISDTHGRHERVDVPDGDILIHAGDLTRGGLKTELKDFNEYLGRLPHDHKLIIAGNCDAAIEDNPDQARQILDNATYLQDDAVDIEGLTFWGSPWQPEFLNMAFNLKRGDELADKWAAIPEETDVLITHGPPRGILDETSSGDAVGDTALRDRIREVRPGLHVFGHIHEAAGVEHVDGTTFVNTACASAGAGPRILEREDGDWVEQ